MLSPLLADLSSTLAPQAINTSPEAAGAVSTFIVCMPSNAFYVFFWFHFCLFAR
jgi:hypothetical protein